VETEKTAFRKTGEVVKRKNKKRELWQDCIGKKYGRLTVQTKDLTNLKNGTKLVCQCECGNIVSVAKSNLGTKTFSCGCLSIEVRGVATIKHGGSHLIEYRSWAAMKRRCYDTNARCSKWYAKRGITVCDRWLNSFENFLADMGSRPSKKYTLERIDNDGNYEPANCRWATTGEQSANRRNTAKLEYEGVVMVAKKACELANVNYYSVRHKHYQWKIPYQEAFNLTIKESRGIL
jgi:hypothetical protein